MTPRYSCIFFSRSCPRSCSYCLAKDVRGSGAILTPSQWADALHLLEQNGVVFHLLLGNELFSYPDPVGFVKALKPFWGRYGLYTTFPPGWTAKYLDDCLKVGLFNISAGVDVWPGLLTGDKHVDGKSDSALHWLSYCKDRGVPDIHATVTIHRRNYNKLEPLFDLCTEKGIWIAVNLVEYSLDGRHDFYGNKKSMENWIIPEEEKSKFRDIMYRLAEEVRKERWTMQTPPAYFEEVGDREMSGVPWHCSLPILISVEEDGALRACGYRGPLKKIHSVFELAPSGKLTIDEYVKMQQECTTECPGCSGGGGAWSYWWQAERWTKGDLKQGDSVFQIHHPGYEFEKTIKK